MDRLYIVNVYSLDEWGEIEDSTEFFTKTIVEAIELKKLIYQKLIVLQLTEEYYIEIEESKFESIETFNEKEQLAYLYDRREFLDKEAKEEQERIQRMKDEYNSLTAEQKEVYDHILDIYVSKLNKSSQMNDMFANCKDFHTIAMEKAKRV